MQARTHAHMNSLIASFARSLAHSLTLSRPLTFALILFIAFAHVSTPIHPTHLSHSTHYAQHKTHSIHSGPFSRSGVQSSIPPHFQALIQVMIAWS